MMIGGLGGLAAGKLPAWALTLLLLVLAAGLAYVALALPHRHKVAAVSAVL